MIGCARLKDGPHYLEESKEQSSTKNKLLVSLFSESSSFNKEKKIWCRYFCLSHPSFNTLRVMFPILF